MPAPGVAGAGDIAVGEVGDAAAGEGESPPCGIGGIAELDISRRLNLFVRP